MPTFENTPEVIKINAFLNKIGISVISKNLPDDTFLPGLELGLIAFTSITKNYFIPAISCTKPGMLR
ncbi:hypothetical protein [Flavobacterium sp. 3HN19-14]|uniref:hypothetical protein n=1 Tax=Flavobacterium sp. 3HN19-14 TaxID=3448133 RepID=UPI003EDED72E